MTTAATARAPGLGVSTAFGIGAVSSGVAHQAVSTLALLFYNQVIGMSPAAVGLALMISLVFDGLWDPAIGLWSDAVRSRIGRRHPFMYASILPAAAAFWMLWNPPAGLSQGANFAYLLATLLAVRLSNSLNEVPSTALAPEMAPDYHARTRLLGQRYFWGVMGAMLTSLLAFQVFLSKSHGGVTNRSGYGAYGFAGAVIIGGAILISCLGTHRTAARYAPPAAAPMRPRVVLSEIWGAFTNRNFAAIMFASLFSGVGGGLTGGLSLYFNLYLWGLSTDDLSVLLLAGLGASIIGVLLAPAVSRRWGKRQVVVLLFSISVFTAVLPMALRLLGMLPGNNWPGLLPLLFAETFVAGTLSLMGLIITTSMLADVVEDNAARTGRRSEGLYFSANSILGKAVTGVGTLASGLMLALVKFPHKAAPGQVSQHIIHTLGLMYLPVALALSLLSVACLHFFRIDQAQHEQNLSHLESLALAEEVAGEPNANRIQVGDTSLC
jgi:GPH family glycoside/pentoside/hexuronide:cation symporter